MSSSTYVDPHTKTGGERADFASKAEGVHEIASQCLVEYEALKLRRKHRYIIFIIGDFEIQIEKIGGRNETFDDFKRAMPYTDCRYGVFDQDYTTKDGRKASKLWFVSWLPINATPYHKMAYTSAKTKFREALTGIFDYQASTNEELGAMFGGAAEEEDEGSDDGFDF